ncbi:hypothetical protein BDQ94DRAFT_184431 [Aspergillus welwitschiae]|uniref:AhpD-like protein n=1 Tax=Aspergillus welwitschiae TaxID=1341132 RepID=A0A3F3PKW4_9EURO|nr:hypothetical protein BDQ94DRAFT_184431 [Aspergillus welwitschiae]RDH27571.1 hypothetical protein BDQ94DRAFT_184431 [Aspergillus welwitschiae]
MATDFDTRYTNANLARDATQYAPELFLALHERLSEAVSSEKLATGIIAAILCAQCRGDVVARLVHDITSGWTKEEVRELFIAVREAITIAVPFVGLPNCMPACFGLVEELKQWEIEKVEGPRRANLGEVDYTARGLETTTSLYRGVGNSEVRTMVQQYFPELSYFGRTTIWGYLVGSSPVLELQEAELIVAASIAAIGATRQTRSHIKCAISIENSVPAVVTLIDTVREIGAWNGKPISNDLDIPHLAEELGQNFANLD